MKKKGLFILGTILMVLLVAMTAMACNGAAGEDGAAGAAGADGADGTAGTNGTNGVDAAAGCVDCHDATTDLKAKQVQYATSVHATGDAFARNSVGCAGCHTSDGFETRMAAGNNDDLAEPSTIVPINCRTCHDIHEAGTTADWALTTVAAVQLELTDTEYDGGAGNLCVNCHQARWSYDVPVSADTDDDGKISITSSRYGPHHGPQSALVSGVGGAGAVAPSTVHYAVEDTCVGCHMGEVPYNAPGTVGDHSFNVSHDGEYNVAAACGDCHSSWVEGNEALDIDGAEDFDRNGVYTAIAADIEELRLRLVDIGYISTSGSVQTNKVIEGVPQTGSASSTKPLLIPLADARALWDYKLIIEDKSTGMHNPAYVKAMLTAALATIPAVTP